MPIRCSNLQELRFLIQFFFYLLFFYRTLLRNQLIPFISNTINNTTKVIKPFPDNSTSLVVNRAEIQPSQALTTTLQEINTSSRKRSAAGINENTHNLVFIRNWDPKKQLIIENFDLLFSVNQKCT